MKLHAEEAARRIGKAAMGELLLCASTFQPSGKRSSCHVTHPYRGQFIFGKTAKEIGVDIDGQIAGRIRDDQRGQPRRQRPS